MIMVAMIKRERIGGILFGMFLLFSCVYVSAMKVEEKKGAPTITYGEWNTKVALSLLKSLEYQAFDEYIRSFEVQEVLPKQVYAWVKRKASMGIVPCMYFVQKKNWIALRTGEYSRDDLEVYLANLLVCLVRIQLDLVSCHLFDKLPAPAIVKIYDMFKGKFAWRFDHALAMFDAKGARFENVIRLAKKWFTDRMSVEFPFHIWVKDCTQTWLSWTGLTAADIVYGNPEIVAARKQSRVFRVVYLRYIFAILSQSFEQQGKSWVKFFVSQDFTPENVVGLGQLNKITPKLRIQIRDQISKRRVAL